MSTWLLLRGLARDSRHWDSFPAQLAAAFGNGTTVATLDLPGNGALNGQRSPASVGEMVEAYRAQRNGPGEPVHLLGLSLGAMVAIEWAYRYPQEVASLVLVNASAGGILRPWQRMRPAAAWTLAGAMLPGRTVQQREELIVGLCSNLAGREAAVARWTRHAQHAQTSPTNAARQLLAAVRFRLPPGRPSAPAVVIASTADRLVSAECSIAIARHWSWPLLLHPSAGHEIALDDPAWLQRQCARWQAGLEHLGS
jgi:pimeloyl-ACP methyl ester carboxylesterase